MAGSPAPALSWDSASSLSPCLLSCREPRATAGARAGEKGSREGRRVAGRGHRGVGAARQCAGCWGSGGSRMGGAGCSPEAGRTCPGEWSLGLVSSSGQFVPSAQGKWNEGGSSQLYRPERLRVGGSRVGKLGLGHPWHPGKGRRRQGSGDRGECGLEHGGPRGQPAKPAPRPPQGPQQTEPCYANLELQTLAPGERERPRQAETEYSTVVSAGPLPGVGARGRARRVTLGRGALVTLCLSRTAPHRKWDRCRFCQNVASL